MSEQDSDKLIEEYGKYNGKEYDNQLKPQVTKSMMNNFSDPPKIKRPNPHRKRKKYIPIRLCATLLAAIAVIAAFTYSVAKNVIPEKLKTLKSAISSGETLKTLGIDENIQAKLIRLQEKMNSGNLTNQEIIEMAPEINNLCFDISRSKLSNVLGVRQENISFDQNIEEGVIKPKIIVSTKYSKDVYLEDSILNKNTFPKEFSNEIKDMITIQKIIQEVQNGSFSRDYILNKYATILQDTENLAASPLKSENGNIVVIERSENKTGTQDLSEKSTYIGATPDQERE